MAQTVQKMVPHAMVSAFPVPFPSPSSGTAPMYLHPQSPVNYIFYANPPDRQLHAELWFDYLKEYHRYSPLYEVRSIYLVISDSRYLVHIQEAIHLKEEMHLLTHN